MKQLSTLFLASIIASAASAQQASISVVKVDGYALNALSISRNGAYICGATWDRDAFVTARDGNPFALMPDDEQGEATGSELRHVSDNGVAVGTNGELGVIFDIEGNRTDLTVPEGYKYFLTEDITADGSQIVGSLTRSWDVVA
ncbi:MAG: hypothetical protein K2F63_03470, partial [Muribaculaceae bacterium]|nr:hypothetical protein [Muribaculaceae bacterium]